MDLRLLETIVRGHFAEVVYLLGACIFYHKNFMKIALENELSKDFYFIQIHFSGDFFLFMMPGT